MAQRRTGLARLFDYHNVKDAVNRALWKQAGGEQRPVFFDDIAAVSPQLADLVTHADQIKAEFNAVYDAGVKLPAYHEVDSGEKEISAAGDPDKRWGVFLLYLLGYKPQGNWKRCPETMKLVQRIPGLVQAFFSVLDPQKSIPLHEGPYLGYLRFHLGLRVPSDNPPTIKVNGRPYTWREGEGVLFDDSWPHEVINHSSGMRAVLIVDILRPMHGVPDMLNKFTTNVVMKYTYGRAVANKAAKFTADAKR